MTARQATKNQAGRLIHSAPTSLASPPALNQQSTLGEIRAEILDHPYILATNDDGRIVGVVSCDRILERLESTIDRERHRWESMHLGALVDAEVSTEPLARGIEFGGDIDCVAVTEDEALVAIAVKDDVFLSLRCIEPTLAAARCDPLTGLMNRLGYERRLAEEWTRAKRTGISIGVIVLDLDNFKQINDCFGHVAGDEVLRRVALILENSLRSYDVVARYGGDEFVALCLDCQPRDIDIPIQRIQQELEQSTFAYGDNLLHVTASIGAAVRHGGFEGSSATDLFIAADDCVYQAKRTSGQPCIIEFGTDSRKTIGAVNTTAERAKVNATLATGQSAAS